MVRIVRSRLAKRDISDVLRFTIERWGKEQARIYRQLILDALEAIAADLRVAASDSPSVKASAAITSSAPALGLDTSCLSRDQGSLARALDA